MTVIIKVCNFRYGRPL